MAIATPKAIPQVNAKDQVLNRIQDNALRGIRDTQAALTNLQGQIVPDRSGFFNAKAFGATGNGGTDDAPAIQRAIDAAAKAGGGQVQLPAGTFALNSQPIPSGAPAHLTFDNKSKVALVGSGPQNTILQAGSTNLDAICITGGASNGLVSDLTITRKPTAVAGGNGIEFFNASANPLWTFRNVQVTRQYHGVVAYSARPNASHWFGCYIYSNVNNGVWLAMNNDEFFSHCLFVANGGNGFVIGDPGGVQVNPNGSVYLTNCLAYNNTGHGIYMSNGATLTNLASNVFIVGGISDSNVLDGIRIESMRNITISGTRCSFNANSASPGANITIQGGAQEISLSGVQVTDSGYDGLAIIGVAGTPTKRISIAGLSSISNNRSNSGYVGVRISGAVDGVNVSGLTSGTGDALSGFARNLQTTGLVVDATTMSPTNVCITGAQFPGQTTPVSFVGTVDQSVHIQTTGAIGRAVLTYSASMTPDLLVGAEQVISVTDGNAFTINAPVNPIRAERLTVRVRNATAGVLGVATWNGVFKMAAWVQPATGQSRAIDFQWDGTNWIETSRTPADVPN